MSVGFFDNRSLFAAGKKAAGVHPIIDAKYGWLYGGTIDGKWVGDDAFKAKIKGGEQYRLYSATKFLGIERGSTPEDVPEESLHVEVDLKKELLKENTVIGICGDWNALPRVPKFQQTGQPAYQQAVHEFLAGKGLPKAKVHITQIWRIDLMGTGVEDVLISATTDRKGYGDEATGQIGDYSMVLLRRIVKGKVVTIPLKLALYPNQKAVDSAEIEPLKFTIDAVLDVDGDGREEIIVRDDDHFGIGKTIIQVHGMTLKEVLSASFTV